MKFNFLPIKSISSLYNKACLYLALLFFNLEDLLAKNPWARAPLYITFYILFTIFLFIYNSEVVVCQPTDNNNYPDEWNYTERPPRPNYATKPVLVPGADGLVLMPELPATPVPGTVASQANNNLGLTELPATPLQSNSSSVVAVNQSIASNIYELGGNNSTNVSMSTTSQNTSMMAENGSVPSNIHELGVDISVRSSIIAEDGSATPTTVGNNNDATFNDGIGYLAPDSAMHSNPHHDYTERVGPGTYSKIVTSLEGLSERIDKTAIKYYGMGKRKLYWKIWEKHVERYENYSDFKADWDPNVNVFKSIFKDIKTASKYEIKTSYSFKNRNTIRQGTQREMQELLRRNNPFARH